MTWNGHLPRSVTCKRCGAILQGAGDGRPAESYLGTYTGFCYPCNDRPAEPTGEVEPSGAREWTHPPSCPSWRRDRERYLGFADCPTCKGTGRVWKYRCDGFGGSYGVNCPDCWKRHGEHPTTIAAREAADRRLAAYRAWSERANLEFNRRIDAAGLDRAKWTSDDPETCHSISAIADDLKQECPPPFGDEVPSLPLSWKSVSKRRRKSHRMA
jgi:hypothetical protein